MTSVIKKGDHSSEVADVQTRLRALGHRIEDVDGNFDDSTYAAVLGFQQSRQLLVDGVVGPQTWAELVDASWRLGDRVLYVKQPPTRGDDVLDLQVRLNALGFDAGREDGIFGIDTDRAVRAFQKEYGVAEDGIFGLESLRALSGLRVERPETAAGLREELKLFERSLAELLIVVDPGHGGADEGAVGLSGVREAELCWDIARRVAELLAGMGSGVRFTRSESESPTVSERAQRANDLRGDLFLSIHLNFHDELTAQGSSCYYFARSRSGATLAEAIQQELVSLGLRDCRSHAQSYALLKETQMPAVLVEPGFVTNPDDLERLETATFRSSLARAIVAGVQRCCKQT